MVHFVIEWVYMNNEIQNVGWEPLPLHQEIPLPPPPQEVEETPVEVKKDSTKGYVINGVDPRVDDRFDDDKIMRPDEM